MRIVDEKSHYVIIDLIGNYRNADIKMRVFAENGQPPTVITSTKLDLPPTSTIQLFLAKGSTNSLDAITAEKAAPYLHRYLTEKKHRTRTDLTDKQSKDCVPIWRDSTMRDSYDVQIKMLPCGNEIKWNKANQANHREPPTSARKLLRGEYGAGVEILSVKKERRNH